MVLTNPPFGTKGANQAPDRDDFTIETSNKPLNFVQHVMSTLKPGGRAALVLPDMQTRVQTALRRCSLTLRFCCIQPD